jgi:pyridoxamine 5'-phosphate oxidase
MSERSGIFAGDDPFRLTEAWLTAAAPEELNDPNAMALATVDADGLPNVRVVLLKEIEADAFVFYTNYESAKGQELIGAGKAAFVLHWKSLRRQVRVRGLVEKEDGPAADAYYARARCRAGLAPGRRSNPGRCPRAPR